MMLSISSEGADSNASVLANGSKIGGIYAKSLPLRLAADYGVPAAGFRSQWARY